MQLPIARGPLSTALLDALRADDPRLLADPIALPDDPLSDDDLQLTLWICYELHYRGFTDVDAHWEWQPDLIALRGDLEEHLLTALRRDVGHRQAAGSIAQRLRELVDGDEGPGLARYMQQRAARAQFDEFAIHRSIYQLKEADPHSWAIARLDGAAKVALLEIQFDEYGDGSAERMHSELYRRLLRGLGLDDGYGAYVDAVPGITLAISNVMSLFGLRRDLIGALVGHLAAYEMTSSEPCRRYARGLRRLGADDATCRFFDEHVTADALHEQLVMHDLCESLAAAEPQRTEDILFGAAACLLVDNRFAEHVLGCWASGRSSLRGSAAVPLAPTG
jgi:pyrroloquinoline quinone (PQQ) biosynthesis protein C